MYNYNDWEGYIGAWELAEPATRENYRKEIRRDFEDHKGDDGWRAFEMMSEGEQVEFIEWLIDQLARDGFVIGEEAE